MVQGFAQYPYYRAITVKSNLLSYWSIAVELPVYRKLTIELSYRGIDYTDFDIKALNNHRKQTIRWNLKYHFPMQDNTGKYYSPYIFAGVNNIQHSVDYKYEYGRLNVDRITLGFGVKRRRIDFWAGCEMIARTHKNEYTTTGPGANTSQWLQAFWPSGGIAINIINIKL